MPQHPPGHRPALAWRDGQVEALKWLALASMLLDHVGRFVLAQPQDGWVFAGGRLAFPLFAGVLGLNLARPGNAAARALRATRRLMLWGAVSVLPSILMRGEPQTLNVLFTLGLGSLATWALLAPARPGLRAVALAAALLPAPWVEFGPAGVLLVALACLWQHSGSAMAGVAAGIALVLVAWGNAAFGGALAFWATLAAVPLALLARTLPVGPPRLGRFFYLFYPLHLAAIGAWRHLA